MLKNSSEPNPIANPWHNLPLPQKNHLVNLVADLVHRQLTKTIQSKGSNYESTCTQCDEKSSGYKREDQVSKSQPKSSNIYSPVHSAASPSSSGVDPTTVRTG
jgi:activator of HSP90 ATPase